MATFLVAPGGPFGSGLHQAWTRCHYFVTESGGLLEPIPMSSDRASPVRQPLAPVRREETDLDDTRWVLRGGGESLARVACPQVTCTCEGGMRGLS